LVRAFQACRLFLVSLSSGPQLSAPSLTSGRLSSPAPPPLSGHPAPPRSAPRVPLSRYHPAFISHPHNSPLKPQPPLQGAPLTPIKGRAPPPDFTAPLPTPLRFSPRSSLASTECRRLGFCTTVARPPRHHPSSGEARAELPMLLSLFCAPAGELWCTGAAGGRTPGSVPPRFGSLSPRRCRSMVDRARPAGSPHVDPVHTFTRWKIIRKSIFPGILQRRPRVSLKSTRGLVFADFVLRPLRYSEIHPP
jgi:hypothetical protein